MKIKKQKFGSALLVTVFTVALLATLVAGILQLTTEQTQLMANQVYATEAHEIAEAGLNDAMAQLRSNRLWNTGFSSKSFAGGSYTVDVNNANLPVLIISATGINTQGYIAKITAKATIGYDSPCRIRIDTLKVNR
jgi:type II secretory pathway component PulK